MIRIIFAIIFVSVNIIGFAQKAYPTLEFYSLGENKNILLSSDIDSITFDTKSGSISQIWDFSQYSGNNASWMTTGSQVVNDMTLCNGYLYVVRRNGSNSDNTIEIVDAYTGNKTGRLNTSTCNIGTHYLSGIEALGNSIIACNLALQSLSDTFVIYKWENDSSEPTTLLSTASLPCTRIGDAMSVSGDMTNGRIWFVYGSHVFYYTITNGTIASATPKTITLTKNGSEYEIASGNSYSNVTVEKDGSFWISSSLPNSYPTHFTATGVFLEELQHEYINKQGTDLKLFTYNDVEYVATSNYLNIAESSLSDGAVSIINMQTKELEGTYPSSGLGFSRNTSFRNSICTEVNDDYYYVWINIPFQGATCYKYSEGKEGDVNIEKVWSKNGYIDRSIIESDSIVFSTITPIVDLNWICTETYSNGSTESYHVILNLDGSVDFSSDKVYVGGAWSYNPSSGTFTIRLVTLADQTTTCTEEWSCTADNRLSPTKFTGRIQRWNSNQIGSFDGGSTEIVLTQNK